MLVEQVRGVCWKRSARRGVSILLVEQKLTIRPADFTPSLLIWATAASCSEGTPADIEAIPKCARSGWKFDTESRQPRSYRALVRPNWDHPCAGEVSLHRLELMLLPSAHSVPVWPSGTSL